MQPKEMKVKLETLFVECMVGRTMYVIPYCMGPLKSPWRRFGVIVTDSPFVVATISLAHTVGTSVC